MLERYTIEVGQDYVKIDGELTIRETFDFLNFFEKDGFTRVCQGDQNSTLYLIRPSGDFPCPFGCLPPEKQSDNFDKILYEQQKQENDRLRIANKQIESLIKLLLDQEKKTPEKEEKNEDGNVCF